MNEVNGRTTGQPGQGTHDAQPGRATQDAQAAQVSHDAPTGQVTHDAPTGQGTHDAQPGRATHDAQPGQVTHDAQPGRATHDARAGLVGHGAPAAHDAQAATAEAHTRADTRQRIQSVALELFAEQGYDKTSLREIAERLGVTKAALYYHFKSKEDIVTSLVEDFYGKIDALIAWGSTLPRTPQARAEVLSRYYGIVSAGSGVFRMLQHNQASVNSLAHAKNRETLYRERMHALAGLLTEPGAPVASELRAVVALASVSFGCMFYAEQVGDDAELRQMVLDIAYELAGAEAAQTSGITR